MADDAVRHHKKKLVDIPLLDLAKGVEARVKGRPVEACEVLKELGGLQNQARVQRGKLKV